MKPPPAPANARQRPPTPANARQRPPTPAQTHVLFFYKRSPFQLRNVNLSTFLSEREARRAHTMCPVFENARSDVAELAGTHRVCRATAATIGHLFI